MSRFNTKRKAKAKENAEKRPPYQPFKGHTAPTFNFPLERREDGTRVKKLLRAGALTVPNNSWTDEKGTHHVMNRARRIQTTRS